ncbi:hypothetical protein N7478_000671 [Penicillium angulare]|uniref:uncharacterized protein n=1 Tax=Penicillium angulare TaxID=116970 RepID=UPI002540356F|nr:uncharacterized protein N7478_000671 [Penicillium angulare]KAJ5291420.1 hypothetical protein N7478_000671 [Penicillium angulare]
MSYSMYSISESSLSSLPGFGIPVGKNALDFNRPVDNQVIPGYQQLIQLGLGQNIQWIAGCMINRNDKGKYDPIFVYGEFQENDYSPLHTAHRVSNEELDYEVSSFAHKCILYPYLYPINNTARLIISLTFLAVDHPRPELLLKESRFPIEARQICTEISIPLQYLHQFETRPEQPKLNFKRVLSNFVQEF